MQIFIQSMLNNSYNIGVLALTTMGLTLTLKTANTTNFSQSIISTFGAFTGGYIVMNIIPNVWIGTIAGVVGCFLLGLIIDAVVIRKASPDGSGRVMITLGLIVLFTAFLPMVFGMVPYEFMRYFKGGYEFTLFGTEYSITKNSLFIFAVSALVIVIIFLALNFTKWGLGMRSTASNKDVASMLGINTNSMTSISWAVSSACGGLAAIFFAAQSTSVSSNMLAAIQTNSLLALVLGGFTTFYGPLLGAVLIVILTTITSIVNSLWARPLAYLVVLIVVLIKPNGLFGKAAAKKV